MIPDVNVKEILVTLNYPTEDRSCSVNLSGRCHKIRHDDEGRLYNV